MIMNDATNKEEEEAYRQVEKALSKKLAPKLTSIPTLVSLRDIVREPPIEDELPSTLLKPNHGHHALFRALEDLDKLDAEVMLEQDTLTKITSTVTKESPSPTEDPLVALQAIGMSIPRRVCQHPFKRNDIVWVCRTCQADETCVLCHECFSQSHHEGHDVAFYHAQAGGCCDCGDPDAWDPAGFCPHHGPSASSSSGSEGLDAATVNRVKGIVPAAVDWLVHTIAANAETAHQRAKPTKAETRKEETTTSNEASLPMDTNNNNNNNNNDTASNNDNEDEDAMAVDLNVFCPEAASTSKSIHGALNSSMSSDTMERPSVTQRLGADGLEGHGLYLVVHADDIHSSAQVISALRDLYGGSSYFTDTLLGRIVRALRQHGQLIVWGTMEVVGVCSNTHVHCWLDGDVVASSRIGSVLLEKAAILSRHGLVCSIATRQELQLEQRAVAVLHWLAELARSCDPLCQTVAESILPKRHLVPMLRADFKVSASITKAWHSLLLTLLAVPAFKSHLAAAYCDTYRYLTSEYASGMGVIDRSAYTLSVQFLNRVTYVVDLVQGRDLLGKLGKALLETFSVALKSPNRLNADHFVLTHRRYSPCISDLKCVLNVKGMARLFASGAGSFLQDWIDSLSLAQFMDGVVWRTMSQGHVEVESRGWVGAFNASISLGSLFERLLSWGDNDASPIDPSLSPLAQNLLSCVELNFHLLTQGLGRWQSREMATYVTKAEMTPPGAGVHTLCPASLPFSTVASKSGTHLAFDALPIAQATEWSFHLPLHRFVAACLREACRRPVGQPGGMEELLERLTTQLPADQLDSLFLGLMEFPSLVLSRAAQIRSGLWRRNGSMMHDQVLNYAEPPFCRSLRDADILLLQFAALGRRPQGEDVGCALMVNLLLHRFGIFDFLGFAKAPQSKVPQYKEEVARGLYNPEAQTQNSLGYVEEEGMALPWTYTPASDLTASLALLEEFLHLLIVLISEIPSMPAKDDADHTQQAKQRLRREVVHRLASGPKTHSELAEVHHVLSHWDNHFLSEDGKLINPDDASAAALSQALAQVAERKSTRGRLAPHHWELTRQAWEDYDPSFFHISTRSHQSAAENRPKPASESTALGVEAKPFTPTKHIPSHPAFERLERDITADATVLAVAYRTLHVHCSTHSSKTGRDVSQLRGSLAYHSDAMSETALARVVHLLTLGVVAWKDARADDKEWRNHGGGSCGSIFHKKFSDGTAAPSARDWVAFALLSPPNDLMDSAWYAGEENMLLLLRRLAIDGGRPGGFISQDRALRSGAAWLCEFAANTNPDAAALIGSKDANVENEKASTGKSDLERRKQAAKQKALEQMKANAAKFALQMKLDSEEADEDIDDVENEVLETSRPGELSPRRQPLSRSTTGSESFHSTSTAASRSPQRSDLGIPQFFSMYSSGGDVHLDDSQNEIPDRLLKERPQCIICVDDGSMLTGEAEAMTRGADEEGKRKRSRRKTGSNALAFVGYAQASTVQKGGGGPPPAIDDHSPLSSARRFAGTHVALCGHVMHSECCESYLASVSHREDRSVGRRDEFRCPLCQRLSNCLVPFIDAGVDWTDVPTRAESEANETKNKDETVAAVKSSGVDDDDQDMDLDDQGQPRQDLHSFLSSTPWWVARNDGSVVWDGQCAFISPETSEEKGDDSDDGEEMDVDDESPQSQKRRRVRSLRKKDLYAAWTAMMRTPRFVMRRRLRPRSSPPSDGGEADARNISQTIWPVPSEETSGETVVWRRLMDLISDVAFKADGKRLGERYLHQYCGEFRHYIVEKSAYNIANREGGRSNVEWPACISTAGTLPDFRRQELSREKLLAKLLMSVQAFTYSSCCESHEAKRVLLKDASSDVAGLDFEQNDAAIHSKYGISGVTCDDKLVLMPKLSLSDSDSDGSQAFDGRLGKLRHLGLAVMAACGAVSADLVQLVMSFPLEDKAAPTPDDPLTAFFDGPTRAPIVFPLLLGHVLTHVVAAMCAACGHARARSDCLELAWPAPFSRRGSFSGPLREDESLSVSVANDCQGFIKLGIIARVLQILLNRMDVSASEESDKRGALVLTGLRQMFEREQDKESAVSHWSRSCFSLLEKALSSDGSSTAPDVQLPDGTSTLLEKQFRNACAVAASEAVSFLSDVGVIFQMLVPGVVATFQVDNPSEPTASETDLADTLKTLRKLQNCMGLETIDDMLESSLVQDIVRNWYETARSHARISVAEESGVYSGKIRSRLYQTEGFRCFDWPMDSIRPYVKSVVPGDDVASTSMLVDTNPAAMVSESKMIRPSSNPLVAFSPKKSIQLLGGYAVTGDEDPTALANPRVATLATSYTDLYATLGSLCPDCDQTAVCLICGEILNAGGKGECTKHSYRCGGGACIFFLLQECVGLILHGDMAAYVHSPYVDSHGETPQYRGRPLNLDLDRYSLLHEMWSGHAIRQKVVSERGIARQVIIADFY